MCRTWDTPDIYRLRQLLDWPGDRFDAMLEQLRAESQVALRIGDASGLSDAERHQSYEVNGQLYLRLCWQELMISKGCPKSMKRLGLLLPVRYTA